jgi:hypothetical protein
MIMKLFLLELVLVGSCIFISHRARLSSDRERKLLQCWLDNVMRDAEQHRERAGKHYLQLVVNNQQGVIE